MIYSIDELSEKLHPIFDESPILRALLFGSYAKGMANESSDVDIVLDSRDELLDIRFYGILEDITKHLGKRIDLFELSEIQQNSSIHNQIMKEAVVLYGREG